MQKVTGIGGIFFRAKDTGALAQWYLDHLGVSLVPQDLETAPWVTQAGVTVFAPFAMDTDYFAADKQFMINFRVDDIAAMTRQLRSAGIEVKELPDMEGVGKFAHLSDPEGTPIELWEPE